MAIQCSTVQYNAIQCNTGQCSAIQCNTVQCKQAETTMLKYKQGSTKQHEIIKQIFVNDRHLGHFKDKCAAQLVHYWKCVVRSDVLHGKGLNCSSYGDRLWHNYTMSVCVYVQYSIDCSSIEHLSEGTRNAPWRWHCNVETCRSYHT
jgi:hypothetical protein